MAEHLAAISPDDEGFARNAEPSQALEESDNVEMICRALERLFKLGVKQKRFKVRIYISICEDWILLKVLIFRESL